MIGLFLIALAIVTSLLFATALRLSSLVSMLLALYLAFVANLGLVTVVLSAFREVTRGGLAVAEGVLFSAALVAWLKRGRPGLPFRAARGAVGMIVSSPITLIYLVFVVALLGYELALGLTVPPDNWDSLTYHLARVAAWAHHGGIYWIPNAPTDRLNEFQPLAEQQLLFLFVATHRDLLYALPQFVAELAILLAIYGAARRLGFEVRAAACSSCLFATFTLVALEATTAQTDLVAASFPAAAACLLLGSGAVEAALAGFALSLGLGAKLTTVVMWPVLACLALVRGRRTVWVAAAGALAGFVTVGCSSYVLNAVHTGRLLGHGGGRVEHTVSPSWPGSFVTGLSILYTFMDLGVLWHRAVRVLAVAGAVAASLAGAYAYRRAGMRRAMSDAAGVAVPFLAPAFVIVAASALAFATRRLGTPVVGPGHTGTVGGLNNRANEDDSDFGPIGAVVLLGVPLLTAASFYARKVDLRRLALACALPSFLILLSLWSEFETTLGRFLIVPAALTAPLLARLFNRPATTAAYVVVSTIVIGLGITRDTTKELNSPYGHPWQISWVQALEEAEQPLVASGLAALQEASVPAHACVGAVLDGDNPAYLLSGRNFQRRVVYLSLGNAVQEASAANLAYVVISTGEHRGQLSAIRDFRARGWAIRDLGGYWALATAPHPAGRPCH